MDDKGARALTDRFKEEYEEIKKEISLVNPKGIDEDTQDDRDALDGVMRWSN
jgi:hypothetical protein